MRLDGAAKGFRRGFGESDVANLAFFYQVCHRADRFFDRRVGIDAVQVIKVDRIDVEAAEARFAGLPNIFGLAAYPAQRWIFWIAHDAELGRDHHAVALALD